MGNNPIFPTTKGILRKLGGEKISGKVLTWDGDTSGAVESIGEQFVKIYDKYMDLSKVDSVRVVATTGVSFSETVPSESLIVQTINEDDIKGLQTLIATVAEEETGLLVSIPAWGAAGLPEGVYVFAGPSLFRAETITFAETIVPIDPKYLGGVCLPVVELETVISGDSAETVLSAVDSAKMDALNGEACILKFSLSLMGDVANIRAVVGSFGFGSTRAYSVSIGPLGNLTFANETDDGTWMCARG